MTFNAENYKELMYDLQRASTDRDSHKLIVKYVDPSLPTMDNILCIKDVIMLGTTDREFTKGHTYRLQKVGGHINAVNDSGIFHGIDVNGKFFNDFFDFI